MKVIIVEVTRAANSFGRTPPGRDPPRPTTLIAKIVAKAQAGRRVPERRRPRVRRDGVLRRDRAAAHRLDLRAAARRRRRTSTRPRRSSSRRSAAGSSSRPARPSDRRRAALGSGARCENELVKRLLWTGLRRRVGVAREHHRDPRRDPAVERRLRRGSAGNRRMTDRAAHRAADADRRRAARRPSSPPRPIAEHAPATIPSAPPLAGGLRARKLLSAARSWRLIRARRCRSAAGARCPTQRAAIAAGDPAASPRAPRRSSRTRSSSPSSRSGEGRGLRPRRRASAPPPASSCIGALILIIAGLAWLPGRPALPDDQFFCGLLRRGADPADRRRDRRLRRLKVAAEGAERRCRPGDRRGAQADPGRRPRSETR